MNLLKLMELSGTGLAAQRIKINAITENLANAETTRTAEGGPYRRKMVVFEEDPFKSDLRSSIEGQQDVPSGVKVSQTIRGKDDFRLVLNPGHPDADPNTGFVAMPNVNTMTEIADMIIARRAYDANVTAINNTKTLIIKALEIGK